MDTNTYITGAIIGLIISLIFQIISLSKRLHEVEASASDLTKTVERIIFVDSECNNDPYEIQEQVDNWST